MFFSFQSPFRNCYDIRIGYLIFLFFIYFDYPSRPHLLQFSRQSGVGYTYRFIFSSIFLLPLKMKFIRRSILCQMKIIGSGDASN